MGKVEKTRLQDTINGLVFYGRYVDDIFCLADGTTDTEDLVQKFNSAHPSLKFTAEAEAGNEIAFLDVFLHRQEDGSIQRRVFRKKTWTGQYVNFHSFVPQNIKRNLVQGLAARVRRIRSPEAIEEELQHLRNTLRENGYPDRFILRNIGERAAKPTVATAEKKELFIRLPFAGDAESELVRRRLTTAITRAFPAAKFRVCFTNSPLLRLEARETIEAWHTETTSINRCVALPEAYQALRTQLNELKSKREVRPDVNPNTGEPTTDLHVATPQIGPDEGAVINTVASTSTPADGEKRGQRDAIKASNPGRQLRSTRMRAMATNVQMPPPDEIQAD
ncbi:hypothetical protein SprV_0100290600 [Sparganum proliferum]